MGFFDFIWKHDPGLFPLSSMKKGKEFLGGGKSTTDFDKPYNLKVTPPPVASLSGWSGSTLGAYLRNFQNIGGGPAPGVRSAVNQTLFNPALNDLPPDQKAISEMSPEEFVKAQTQAPGSKNVVPSLVANSVGGAMSSAAAALYGRMLGGAPPDLVRHGWNTGGKPKTQPSVYVPPAVQTPTSMTASQATGSVGGQAQASNLQQRIFNTTG